MRESVQQYREQQGTLEKHFKAHESLGIERIKKQTFLTGGLK